MSGVRPRDLDLMAAGLDGTAVVEASAGTGKTYTITALFIRLLLETEVTVDQILVVTYTRAATAELRDRIRRRMLEVRTALEDGGSGTEAFVEALVRDCTDPEVWRRRLTAALRCFDDAAIHTIHGFCQRVLAECALESGIPFDMETAGAEESVAREVVMDYWRRNVYDASPGFVAHLRQARVTPDALARRILPHVGRPYLVVRGPTGVPDVDQPEVSYEAALAAAREAWTCARETVSRLLLEQTGLDRRRYGDARVRRELAWLDDFLGGEPPGLPDPGRLAYFSPGEMGKYVKKGREAPEHSFFDRCEDLAAAGEELARAYEAQVTQMEVDLLAWCSDELEKRRQRARVQSYDDLLNTLDRALQGPGGERLARYLRGRYRAALVDEFQDTDPVQYAIFRRVFGESGLPLRLVGDPKQAIYSFRGADVFAYLRGRGDAQEHLTLGTNHRSTPGLVGATNALFARVPRPFLLDELPFFPVKAADPGEPGLEIDDGLPSLGVWFLPRREDGKSMGKGEARARVIAAVVAEVSRLLTLGETGRARVDGRGLEGGDLAVLVRTHREAGQVHDALAAAGVPSVRHTQDSVFGSAEALDLERVLDAIVSPRRPASVRTALATDMLGRDGAALDDLAPDGDARERCVATFQARHDAWRTWGFMRMFRDLLRGEGVAPRLLSLPDGERRLTNLLHLGELIHARERSVRGGMEVLLQWFRGRRAETGPADDEQQLRLESDQHLVKIVTVHKSKGLEYPITFCPFLWDARTAGDDGAPVVFHDPEMEHAPVLVPGGLARPEERALAARESYAENLRLTYVALTRARYRCYTAWGGVSKCDASPLGWLLGAGAGVPGEQAAVQEPASRQDDATLRGYLQALADAAGGAAGLLPLPEGAPEPRDAPEVAGQPGGARRFGRVLERAWSVTSFSGLTERTGAERPDHDESVVSRTIPSETPLAEAHGIAGFPRGAAAGRCLHAVLEHVEFAGRDREAVLRVAAAALREHGIDEGWRETVADAVDDVLETPLDESGLRLGTVTAERRVSELEFHYPIDGLRARAMERVLERHGFDASAGARAWPSFSQGRGYVKGFVDLLFERDGRHYIADYKSNWLGPTPDDYTPERLAECMAREGYHLQYLLYVVALHRHLALRCPGYSYERHVGGVFYLFLRGMSPATGPARGVFAHRPPAALVEDLDALMGRGG